MSNDKLEMGSLDEKQLETLREQLKAAVGGGAPVPVDLRPEDTHSSHGDTDGWI